MKTCFIGCCNYILDHQWGQKWCLHKGWCVFWERIMGFCLIFLRLHFICVLFNLHRWKKDEQRLSWSDDSESQICTDLSVFNWSLLFDSLYVKFTVNVNTLSADGCWDMCICVSHRDFFSLWWLKHEHHKGRSGGWNIFTLVHLILTRSHLLGVGLDEL